MNAHDDFAAGERLGASDFGHEGHVPDWVSRTRRDSAVTEWTISVDRNNDGIEMGSEGRATPTYAKPAPAMQPGEPMKPPKYLMWFTRFGQPHLEPKPTLEACFELDWLLEDAENYERDQYGGLFCVEEIGVGVIPDDEYDTEFEAYKTAEAARREAERATQPPPRSPVGMVEITSVIDHLYGDWVQVGYAYNAQELDALRQEWVAAVGRDRVNVRTFESDDQ